MKSLITQKEERLLHATVFWYCDVYYLLYYEDPIYYTRNIYGRRADIYKLEHPKTGETFYISTWYGPNGIKPTADYHTIQKRETKKQKPNTKQLQQKPRTKKKTKSLNFISSMLLRMEKIYAQEINESERIDQLKNVFIKILLAKKHHKQTKRQTHERIYNQTTKN